MSKYVFVILSMFLYDTLLQIFTVSVRLGFTLLGVQYLITDTNCAFLL